MFQFAHPLVLYAFVVIPIIILLYIISERRKKKLLSDFGDINLVSQLMPDRSTTRPVLKLVLLLIFIAFFVLGLAGPQFGTKLHETKRRGAEIIIALDVSNSMMATDIQPNRLVRAKQAIAHMVDRLKNDKIGLIVFAGEAYTQLPITNDYVSAKMFLSNVNTNMVSSQGTAIGAAINLASNSFTPDEKTGKAIILITDGENHEDNAVTAAADAYKKGIIVHAIGIGSPQGAPIPVGSGQNNFLKDANGNVVITKLDEELLQQVTAAGGGTYVRANNADIGLNTILGEVNKMTKSAYEAKIYSDYEDQFQWPMGVALLLLFIELIILERKTKWSGKLNLFETKS